MPTIKDRVVVTELDFSTDLWALCCLFAEMTTLLEKDFKAESKLMLPPNEFLYDNPSKGCPSHNYFPSSAVIPSLPLTIKWLRDCVREHPSTRLQVSNVDRHFILKLTLLMDGYLHGANRVRPSKNH